MQIKDVLEIMENFDKKNIDEILFKTEGAELTLRKHPRAVPVENTRYLHEPVVMQRGGQAGHDSPQNPAVDDAKTGFEIILSPIVGTFYRSPSPDSPPFVREGETVKKGQSLCIIEAMKVMNSLDAEFDCEMQRVLVENGTMVECGMPLFEVVRT